MTEGHEFRVLAINAGSSSLKSAIYRLDRGETLELSAIIERIGQPSGSIHIKDGKGLTLLSQEEQFTDHGVAIQRLLDYVDKRFAAQLDAAGHRIVYGGAKYVRPYVVDDGVLRDLQGMVPRDPEHLPQEIAAMRAIARAMPSLPQVASFDSAFHSTMPKRARTYAIPRWLTDDGVVRYGFHGISYEYVLEELRREAGEESANGRIIVAHLGNGASMAAVSGGHCIDTTMGFTPAAGLVMSTRTGDIDPGILLYLAGEKGFDAKRLNDLANRQSGLLGVSGISSDMAELLSREGDEPAAAEAVDMFCYVAKKFVGALSAALGGLDTLVFTAGIGENAPQVRERICRGLAYLGIEIDGARNKAKAAVISSDESSVRVRIIPTNEELMLARHARDVLRSKTD